jgi:hypothetical protein
MKRRIPLPNVGIIAATLAAAVCLIGASAPVEPTESDLAQVLKDARFAGAVDSWSGARAGSGAKQAFEDYLAKHDYQDIRKGRCNSDGDGGFTCEVKFVRVVGGNRIPGQTRESVVNDSYGWTERQPASADDELQTASNGPTSNEIH